MTFAIFENGNDHSRRLVGTLWASDEANAKAIAPVLLGTSEIGNVSIERSEEREIPLKVCDQCGW